eukprot:CAMPEP_0177647066 /NCGR_PEP_ID=MMETSP0447-20121125/10107_1 /TAXON_ID=0 /ORGANISM="Stygamoeba regulata, Strain BSH-02190019" /LENGTH=511 /DNA_ID=CAMNT_0019149637 /DNA_START=139 /DNA_END=1674 /DNA_ORIENTATION=+
MSDPVKKPASMHKSAPARVMTEVTPPRSYLLAEEDLWDKDGLPIIANLRQHLFEEGRLAEKDCIRILETASALLHKEPNLLDIDTRGENGPVAICGDTHGQFYDLLKLFEVGGEPLAAENSKLKYLFLGDYVDRGLFSLEVVLYLFALKIVIPDRMFLLRGNHECRHLTDHFTFKEECIHKYSKKVYNVCMDSFDQLPLAAVVNEEFLCIHGGISPAIKTLDDIRACDRFMEPPQNGVMCDLLWSDPMEEYDEFEGDDLFFFNDVRSCSYVFSYEAACNFLDENNLRCIIRAHEAQDEGYRTYKAKDGFPTVITLFSAPNYLDAYNNKGSLLVFGGEVMNIRQFEESPHPYHLPSFMNVFAWSLPFVAEKVSEVLLKILEVTEKAADADEEGESIQRTESDLAARKEAIRTKIRAIGRMRLMFGEIRSKNLALVHQGSDGTLPTTEGDFQKVRKLDLKNERRWDSTDALQEEAIKKAMEASKLKREKKHAAAAAAASKAQVSDNIPKIVTN